MKIKNGGRCFVQLGMRELAIRQFTKCEKSLRNELNVTPCKSTRELYLKILEEEIIT